MPYCRLSLIDLYLQPTYHQISFESGKNVLQADARMYVQIDAPTPPCAP